MSAHAISALGSRSTGLEQPLPDFGSKKDDEDDFGSALGIAMFAIPSSMATPIAATEGSQRVPARASSASPADGAPLVGSNPPHSTQPGIQTGSAPGAASTHSAATTFASSFKNLASQTFDENTQSPELSNLLRNLPLPDENAPLAQPSDVKKRPAEPVQSIDRNTGDSIAVAASLAKSTQTPGVIEAGSIEVSNGAQAGLFERSNNAAPQTRAVENFADGAFTASVTLVYHPDTAVDSTRGARMPSPERPAGDQQVIDGVAASPLAAESIVKDSVASIYTAGPAGNRIIASVNFDEQLPPRASASVDNISALVSAKPGPISYGAPVSTTPKPLPAASQSAVSIDNTFENRTTNSSEFATSPSADKAPSSPTEAAPTSDRNSQPKSESTRTNVLAGEEPSASSAITDRPDGGAAGLPSTASDVASEFARTEAIEQVAEAIDHATGADDDKRSVAPRTPEAAIARSSAADGPVTPALSQGPAETGNGAPAVTATVAPTLRIFSTPPSDTRIASLTIDMAGGEATQATVREHSGAVDVRIVAPSQQNAQLISSELPALRRALDAAGIQLKAADVSHHGDDQGGGRGRDQDNAPPQRQSHDSAGFALEEVNQ